MSDSLTSSQTSTQTSLKCTLLVSQIRSVNSQHGEMHLCVCVDIYTHSEPIQQGSQTSSIIIKQPGCYGSPFERRRGEMDTNKGPRSSFSVYTLCTRLVSLGFVSLWTRDFFFFFAFNEHAGIASIGMTRSNERPWVWHLDRHTTCASAKSGKARSSCTYTKRINAASAVWWTRGPNACFINMDEQELDEYLVMGDVWVLRKLHGHARSDNLDDFQPGLIRQIHLPGHSKPCRVHREKQRRQSSPTNY